MLGINTKKRFPSAVENRASLILSELAQGTHWSRIQGYAYRLPCKSTVLVYRLPAWHRLLLRLEDGLFEVMSHESYNKAHR